MMLEIKGKLDMKMTNEIKMKSDMMLTIEIKKLLEIDIV